MYVFAHATFSQDRCHGLGLSGLALELPRYWPISRSHWSRNAQTTPGGQSEFFVPFSRLQAFNLL